MNARHDVRTLTDPAERRAAFDVFLATLHRGRQPDEPWEAHGQAEDEHWLGVHNGAGEVVGSAHSFPSRVTVPGGNRVSAAAVTAVGVRPDSTRAGRLSALMRVQLAAARDRGDVVTVLQASEGPIYGRFGYGVAAHCDRVRVSAKARWRPDAPVGGDVRMIAAAEASRLLPGLQERLAGTRPGAMTRNPLWWRRALEPAGEWAAEYRGFAVHTGPDGDDGFAVWGIEHGDLGGVGVDRVALRQLFAASPAATAGLWRFLVSIDLSESVIGRSRPTDENLELMLADPRACRIVGREDDLWLRIVDLGAAFAARAWGGADPVVLRVHDALFDETSTWRIGPGGAVPAAGAAPDLECAAESLAPTFLGDRTPSAMVGARRWCEHTPGATARADALFTVPGPVPWCGTMF